MIKKFSYLLILILVVASFTTFAGASCHQIWQYVLNEAHWDDTGWDYWMNFYLGNCL